MRIKDMSTAKLLSAIMPLVLGAFALRAQVMFVERPQASGTNGFYPGNRAPLLPSQLIELPTEAIEPRGWLLAVLQRQRAGLTGHLGEISAWLQKEDNAWLSRDGKGNHGWEEVPYWLRGYMELAYILKDPQMVAETQVWINGVLASQRQNGDFGPDQRFDDDGTRDFWANMIMLYCLESYYGHTRDRRVLDLMTKYFNYHLHLPDRDLLTHYWQKMRGGDELQAVYWLYNITGNPQLLDLAAKVHRCTANWELKDDLPNWHNVNIAEGFREPGEYYLQTHEPGDLRAAYANFLEVRKRYGQAPGGMFGADENCRPGYTDPRQAIETCGMVEQMFSDEMLMQISGDPFWADQCEEVAFNSYPAAVMPDFSALRYLTAPNMVVSDAKNHAPGIENAGPFLMMNPFSARCCQHNHSFGWPYYCKHLWYATPDNGVCAALYSASKLKARVGDGSLVQIEEEGHYPFEDTIQFKIRTPTGVTFPLYLRIPAWSGAPNVVINGKAAPPGPGAGKFIRITRQWADGDILKLQLPMSVAVKKYPKNHDCVSVSYGPLEFSLKIGEHYTRVDSTKTAIGDSSWQKNADPSQWPAYEIHPTTPWNYGLVLDAGRPEESFSINRRPWPADDFPFSPEAVPLTLQACGKQVPEWTLDRFGLCSVLQDSPVYSEAKTEVLSLIPMGAARLRISAFPVISDDPNAHHWKAIPTAHPTDATPSASHCFGSDTVAALNDGIEPASSGDQDIPRFTWWDHKGTLEWVQYDFPRSRELASVAVYWFDDTGRGECRIPSGWRLLYRDGTGWKPVSAPMIDTPARDRWCTMKFQTVETSALRLEVQLQPNFSGGILEWKANPPKIE